MVGGCFSSSMVCRSLGAVLPPDGAAAVCGGEPALWGASGRETLQPDWSALSTISLSCVIAVMALGHPA